MLTRFWPEFSWWKTFKIQCTVPPGLKETTLKAARSVNNITNTFSSLVLWISSKGRLIRALFRLNPAVVPFRRNTVEMNPDTLHWVPYPPELPNCSETGLTMRNPQKRKRKVFVIFWRDFSVLKFFSLGRLVLYTAFMFFPSPKPWSQPWPKICSKTWSNRKKRIMFKHY